MDYLISPAINEIVIDMIGPHISPYANGKKWFLSRRLTVNIRRGVYHELLEEARNSGTFDPPDLVIGTA